MEIGDNFYRYWFIYNIFIIYLNCFYFSLLRSLNKYIIINGNSQESPYLITEKEINYKLIII